jgi:hypothetical protein
MNWREYERNAQARNKRACTNCTYFTCVRPFKQQLTCHIHEKENLQNLYFVCPGFWKVIEIEIVFEMNENELFWGEGIYSVSCFHHEYNFCQCSRSTLLKLWNNGKLLTLSNYLLLWFMYYKFVSDFYFTLCTHFHFYIHLLLRQFIFSQNRNIIRLKDSLSSKIRIYYYYYYFYYE